MQLLEVITGGLIVVLSFNMWGWQGAVFVGLLLLWSLLMALEVQNE